MAPVQNICAALSNYKCLKFSGNSGAPTVPMLCCVCSKQFDCGKSCKECDMQFCMACDERWHCEKLKGSHIRTSLPGIKDEAEEQRFEKNY